MAQKKKRRVSWGRKALYYLLFPLIVWGIALLFWFYWYDLRRLFNKDYATKDRPKAARQSERRESEERPSKNRAQEKILDDDRKKLDDIIKRRG